MVDSLVKVVGTGHTGYRYMRGAVRMEMVVLAAYPDQQVVVAVAVGWLNQVLRSGLE